MFYNFRRTEYMFLAITVFFDKLKQMTFNGKNKIHSPLKLLPYITYTTYFLNFVQNHMNA
jgi:hypothetical protein